MPEIRPIITKPENIRNAIRSRVVEAISAKFPIETQNCTAVLKHIEVERVGASSDKQTEALMSRGNIHDGVYADIPGLCRVAGRKEIEEKNFSLTPGAYVGVPPAEDDGVDFARRMNEIHAELVRLQAESNALMETISRNWQEMGL